MAEFAAWVVGADRPGIVAAVTGAVYEAGGNLEDCSMTILSGHFTIMLVVRMPEGVGAGDLEGALRAAGDSLDLQVGVSPIDSAESPPVQGEPHIVAVYGADRPGIVHRVSALLADRGVNITDLTTRVIGSADDPVYAMHLEVALPDSVAPDDLGAALAEVAGELGVDTSIHPVDTDVL